MFADNQLENKQSGEYMALDGRCYEFQVEKCKSKYVKLSIQISQFDENKPVLYKWMIFAIPVSRMKSYEIFREMTSGRFNIHICDCHRTLKFGSTAFSRFTYCDPLRYQFKMYPNDVYEY
jgi:hypothetical protein